MQFEILQIETYDVVRKFREVLDSFQRMYTTDTHILMTPTDSCVKNALQYGGRAEGHVRGAQIPLNNLLTNELDPQHFTAHDFMYFIQKWMAYTPNWMRLNWEVN